MFEKIKTFFSDEKAYGETMKTGIVAIVALVVIAILASALLPAAITSIVDTNTTAWSAGAVSMWDAVPIFLVLVFLLIVIGLALGVF